MSDIQAQGQLDLDFLTRGDDVGKKVPLNSGQGSGDHNPLRKMEEENHHGSICDNKVFIMKTHEGLVDKRGSKIQWTKNTYLKLEDPPPGKESNLSN